jgi:flagellar P-ring protein precursor FlgI
MILSKGYIITPPKFLCYVVGLKYKVIFLNILLSGTFIFAAEVRIKDIVTVENALQESLVGYGLVTGLNGTGDRASNSRGSVFTVQSISNMLDRFGITVSKEKLRTRNVAAVMVTAKTPTFGRVGSQFDVTVSSLGDATSLEGGILLATPLLSVDGTYYGQAQGAVSTGGYNIETSEGEKTSKNHALVGRVPNGAMLKKMTANQEFDFRRPVQLLLIEPDFVTANRIAEAINSSLNNENNGVTSEKPARPVSAGLVEITFPESIKSQEEAVFFIAGVETLLVEPDIEARVVINERTGVIVAGGNARIGEVMISHGNMTIQVKRTPIISQPVAPFSNAGQTVVEYQTETIIRESDAKTAVIKPTTTVSDLASALNELGMKPRDIISIFQAIKEAGALTAKLIIM